MKKPRIAYWDRFKGLLMVLVVAAHILLRYKFNDHVKPLYDLLILFTMPAFAFVSGYFSKSEKSASGSALSRLALLYAIFNSIYIVWFSVFSDYYQLVEPYYVHWYLLAMIVWRFAVSRLHLRSWTLPFFIILALLIGFWQDVGNDFALGRIIGYFPFFLAGWLLPSRVSQWLTRKPRWTAAAGGALLVICASVSVIISYFYEYRYWLTWHYFMNYYTQLSHLALRCGIFVLSSLFIIGLLWIIPTGEKGPGILARWGKNSLWIFLFHRPFTILFNEVFGSYSQLFYPAVIVTAILILVVFGSDRFARVVGSRIEGLVNYIGATILSGERSTAAIVCWCVLLAVLALPMKEYLL